MQPAGGADSALDALSDTLKDIAPAPHPEPAVPTKDIVEVADWTGVASGGGVVVVVMGLGGFSRCVGRRS